MQDWIQGKIVEEQDDCYLVSIPKVEEIKEYNITDCLIKLQHPTLITDEQRKKAWVLIGDIAEGTNRIGRFKDAVHNEMKELFCKQNYITRFSLSNCSREMATRYIEFLISYILKNNIPSEVAVQDFDDSIARSLYARYMSGKCMICEEPFTRLYLKTGTGVERTGVDKLTVGDEIYFLCDKHGEYLEKKGKKIFDQVYILEPLRVGNSVLNNLKEKGKEENGNRD